MELPTLVAQVAAALKKRGWTCATAESCTGGLIGAALTAQAGASLWYKGGIIAYANACKTAMLGVPQSMLDTHGAVSEAVARAMARGASAALGTQAAVAVTGVAGPDGGSAEKPVGTVWIAWAMPECCTAQCFLFSGDREAVRQATVAQALQSLVEKLAQPR